MTKTDELISKEREYLAYLKKAVESDSYVFKITEKKRAKFESAISQLKEQIKKEENINDFTIPYLKSEYNQQLERITKIIGKKPDVFEQGINALLYIIENKINPDVMPDTCCGKYKEVIGFDVIERHNKKCFDDTLENIKKSMKEKEQPLKSAEEIYKKVYIKSEADLPKDTGKHIVHIPINDEVYSVHLETMITQWKRFDWYLQPVKDITDEEINKKIFELTTSMRMWDGKSNPKTIFEHMFEIAIWMRDKMKS